MSNEFSSFNRQPGKGDTIKGTTSGGYSLLLLGGAVVLAAMVGGGGVYFLMSLGGTSGPSAANNNAPAATARSAPAANGSAQAPAAAVPWTTAGTFGSWQVRCQNANNAATKLCTAVLEVVDNKTKQVLMAWIIGPDSKGGMQTVFQTPSGVMVGSGIDVKFANAPARHINFLSCLPQQCTAVSPMDEAFVKETIAAPKADITVYAANGKSLAFGIPVTGIDKALAAIKK